MTAFASSPDILAAARRADVVAVNLASEAIATFCLLAVTQSAGALLITPFVPAGLPHTLATALSVMVTIVAIIKSPFGRLSGAHMNPAVSFAFFLEGHLTAVDFVSYLIGQVLGAAAAAAALGVLVPDAYAAIGVGMTHPSPALHPLMATLLEGGATFGLVSLLFWQMGAAHRTGYTAFTKAAYLGLAVMMLKQATGASLNPARSLGPALVAGSLDLQWVYLAGPLAGAAVAVLVHRLVPSLPRPLFHRLDHDHSTPHYTLAFLEDWQRRLARFRRLVGGEEVADPAASSSSPRS